MVLARVAPAGFWLRALELLQAAELELRQPVDARLQVEFCVMRLVTQTTLGDAQLAALEARVAHLEGAPPSPPPPGASTGSGGARFRDQRRSARPRIDPAATPAPERPAAAPMPERRGDADAARERRTATGSSPRAPSQRPCREPATRPRP